MFQSPEIEKKIYVNVAKPIEAGFLVDQPSEVTLHTSRDRQGTASKLPAFIPHQEVDRQALSIEASPSSLMEFEIYTPKEKTELNTIFYIPGTASQTIAIQPVRAVLSQISHILGVRVIAIFHDLAPMNKHPIPYNEVCEAINLLLNKSDIKLNKIAIGGDSSGGLLALLVAIQAVHRHIPFSQILLFAPVVDLQATLSLQEKPGQGFGTPKFFKQFVNTYLPTDQKPDSPEVSPYHCRDELLHQLPPVILVSGVEDTIHESIVAFSEKLDRYHFFALEESNHGFVWQSTNYLEKIRVQVSFYFQQGINVDKERFFPLEIVSIKKPERLGNPPVLASDQHILRLKQERELRVLLAKQQGDKSISIAILGESGRGKTQFALNYYYSSQQYSHCYWFDASSEEQLQMQFIVVGTEAKLSFGEMNVIEKIKLVKKYLESHKKALIIFDNAVSQEILKDFMPQRQAHILITSLSLDSWTEAMKMLPLEEEEARKLVLKYFQHDFKPMIQELKKQFSLSPLGLFHAAARRVEEEIAEEAYLQEISFLKRAQPDRDFAYYAVKLRLRSLASKFPKEYQLLQLISIFELSTIPLIVFTEENKEVLRELEKKGFIVINDEKKTLFCHAIINQVVFQAFEAEKAMLRQIASLGLMNLNNYFNQHPRDSSLIYLVYLKKITTLIEKEKFIQYVDRAALISLYIKLANILGFKLNSVESVAMAERSVSLAQAGEVSDKLKLDAVQTLMQVCWETGNMNRGFEESKKVLFFCQARAGDEFFKKKLAHAKHNTALFYRKIGDLSFSRQLLEEAIELLGTLTDEGEEAVKNKKNQALGKIILGFFVAESKDYDTALLIIKEAENILEPVVPNLKEDEMYLSMLLEVRGLCLSELHRIEGPSLLRESLSARIKQHGETHRLVAETKARLAYHIEDFMEADRLFSSALETLYQLYQKNNHFIADCYFLIGQYLLKLNRQDLAQLYFLETLRIRRIEFPEHYDRHYQVDEIKGLLCESGMRLEAIEPAIHDSLRHAINRRKILQTYFTQRAGNQAKVSRLSACQKYLFFGSGLTVGIAVTAAAMTVLYQP